METTKNSNATLVAELNDLLQLDYDAVQSYSLAERELSDEINKGTIARFKGDHERHIGELTRLINAYGGKPLQRPPLSTAPAKLGVQAAGAVGGDVVTLLAFKANERLSRDKYQRAANAGYPSDVHAVLSAGADDESRHYSWVQETLEELGAGEETAAGRVEKVVETGHARVADAMEGAGKSAAHGAEALRRSVADAFGNVSTRLAGGGTRNVWIALGVGLVASQLVGRRGRARRQEYPALQEELAVSGSDSSSWSDRAERTPTYDESTSSPSTSTAGALSTRSTESRAGYPGWSDSAPLTDTGASL
jgi:rubrerythrin